MSHTDEIKERTTAVISTNSIVEMNEWLVTLSNDEALGREERYAQQQRLRHAIVHYAQRGSEEAARQERLTRGGNIL